MWVPGVYFTFRNNKINSSTSAACRARRRLAESSHASTSCVVASGLDEESWTSMTDTRAGRLKQKQRRDDQLFRSLWSQSHDAGGLEGLLFFNINSLPHATLFKKLFVGSKLHHLKTYCTEFYKQPPGRVYEGVRECKWPPKPCPGVQVLTTKTLPKGWESDSLNICRGGACLSPENVPRGTNITHGGG